jgi:hypothetical protein
MSGAIIPGYDFTTHEEVTGDKLLKYVTQSYIDPENKIQAGAFTLITGASLPASSSEGALALDAETGKVCVYSRWGWVPVLGGGFFSKRFRSDIWDGYGQLPFFTALAAMGSFKATRLSLASVAAAGAPDWFQDVPFHTKRVGQDGRLEVSPAVLWPSPDNTAPANTSELTAATSIHRLLCLRGFTPIRMTAVTTYSSYYPNTAGSSWAFLCRSYNAEYEQGQIDWPIWSIPHTYQTPLGGTSLTNSLYMGYIKARLHISSTIGVPYMNGAC